METVPQLQPIPRPPGHLFVGNLFDLNASHPIESLMDLARNYGRIFQIEVPGVVPEFEKCWQAHERPPTAVITINDVIAVGTLHAA